MKRPFQIASAAAAVVMAIVFTAPPALAKNTRCKITTSDGVYAGSCDFTRTKGGSFSVGPVGRADFFTHAKADPGITEIDVDIEGSRAEVRALTTDGINSRWGAASRSRKDRACWVSDDFSICVY